MDITLLLEFNQRQQLRNWLQENHASAKECWVVLSRSKNTPAGALPYLDVVEEALCFGWIDSTLKKLPDEMGSAPFMVWPPVIMAPAS